MQKHTLRDIALFVAAYEERSFTVAAIRENATQSGVSQHVKKLEDAFGVVLFNRASGSITPTPAADVYYRHCLEVLKSSGRAENELMAYKGELFGDVTVGLIPSVCRSVLAPAITRFTEANPNVRLTIVDGFSALLVDKVASGELAFAVVPYGPVNTGLTTRKLFTTPEVLVSSAKQGLPHLGVANLDKMTQLRLVVPTTQNVRRSMIMQYLSMRDLSVSSFLEMDSMLGCLDLVEKANWNSILPGIMMANEINSPEPSAISISVMDTARFTTDIVAISRVTDELTPPAEAFLATFEDVAVQINRQLTSNLSNRS